VTLYRCFAWNHKAEAHEPDGPLWVPRVFQGDGRHDNPEVYGCLYLADRPVSCLVEQLARFRGQLLTPAMLFRRTLPLALAELELDPAATLIDLDDPRVLVREDLAPSRVATRQRSVTQSHALDLHQRYPEAAGLRWWSTFEALWATVTLFERAARRLQVRDARTVAPGDPVLAEAADWLGLSG
jgi:hypothetical protein